TLPPTQRGKEVSLVVNYDYDFDGFQDLCVAVKSADASILFNDGTGTFPVEQSRILFGTAVDSPLERVFITDTVGNGTPGPVFVFGNGAMIPFSLKTERAFLRREVR